MKIIIHGPNVHQGGGATLLRALLAADTGGVPRRVHVDERFSVPDKIGSETEIRPIERSLQARVRAELMLKQVAQSTDIVLCVGNLPPLFRLRAKTFLFLQNRLLLDGHRLVDATVATRLRVYFERMWLRFRLSNADNVIVQTATMQRLVQHLLRVEALRLPFLPGRVAVVPETVRDSAKYDFVYVSSGERHKNHRALIAAWQLLAREGLRPSLCVTVNCSRHAELCSYIDAAIAADELHITNIGSVSEHQIDALYDQASALIYPSLLESFGLPLLEAYAKGLPIVAPELDYVRDIVEPATTFDPMSPVSIARAVRRQLGFTEPQAVSTDGTAFLQKLVQGGLQQCGGDIAPHARRNHPPSGALASPQKAG